MSMITGFFGLALLEMANWRIESPDAVQVWPNNAWPTSIETFGCLAASSQSRAAPEEKFLSPSVP
jgi:hypothetical protein